jgi:hypothetical protein
MATPFSSSGKVAALVHAGGDDPLVKQETIDQLSCKEPKPVSSLERGSATSLDQSSLCSIPDASIQIYKSSRFVGCLIVKSDLKFRDVRNDKSV